MQTAAGPVITVKEVSRLLILLKKRMIKKGITLYHYRLVLNDVRNVLELRKRSREGLNKRRKDENIIYDDNWPNVHIVQGPSRR